MPDTEVGDDIPLAIAGPAVAGGHKDDVLLPSRRSGCRALAADQGVVICAAKQLVIAPEASQQAIRIVGMYRVANQFIRCHRCRLCFQAGCRLLNC